MQNWDTYVNYDFKGQVDKPDKQCNAQKDFNDAKAVADKLGIKIYRTEFINEYWNEVFTYLITEYKKGNTPNPDVLCNKFIKFDHFIKYAKNELNCEKIAMGHYANVKQIGNKFYLTKSVTEDKDQTYFLCWLNQESVRDLLHLQLYRRKQVHRHPVRNILLPFQQGRLYRHCLEILRLL